MVGILDGMCYTMISSKIHRMKKTGSRQTNRWTDKPTDPPTHGPRDPRTHGPTDAPTDTPSYTDVRMHLTRTGGSLDRWTDGRTDGRTDKISSELYRTLPLWSRCPARYPAYNLKKKQNRASLALIQRGWIRWA